MPPVRLALPTSAFSRLLLYLEFGYRRAVLLWRERWCFFYVTYGPPPGSCFIAPRCGAGVIRGTRQHLRSEKTPAIFRRQ